MITLLSDVKIFPTIPLVLRVALSPIIPILSLDKKNTHNDSTYIKSHTEFNNIIKMIPILSLDEKYSQQFHLY